MPLHPPPGMIDETTVFDLAIFRPNRNAHGFDVGQIYNEGTKVGIVNFVYDNILRVHHLEFDDPEFLEIMRRVRAGTCEVRYGYNYPGVSRDDVAHVEWEMLVENPFEEAYGFFEHLAHYGRFVEGVDGSPNEFHFPGLVVDASSSAPTRYWKRGDSVDAPDVRADSELAGAGWTPTVPYGPHRLHSIQVVRGDGIAVTDPVRVHRRRPDTAGSIVSVARAWDRYWRGLTSSERGINIRMTARKHFEHAIGRAWSDKPFDSSVDVVYPGRRDSSERPARDAEDWMLGNLEQWAHEWGFAAFATAISQTGKSSVLESELGDYTFCHVDEDGDIGDRLSNGPDGITEATWDAYQDTHYPAAVRHGVDTLAVESLTIIVHQGTAETAQLVVTGGLAPFAFEVTATAPVAAWASINAATGEVTVAPDAAETAQDYIVRVKVTDDLGTEVYRDVTVTVRADE